MASQLTGSILNCILDPIMIFGMFGVATNRILESVSSTAIAFYGVFGKLQNFMFMPVNGLSQGIVPIVGYFYGAKKPEKFARPRSFRLK